MRFILLVVALCASVVILSIGFGGLSDTNLPQEIKYQALTMLLIGSTGILGVVLSALAKNWLSSASKTKGVLIAVVLFLPILDILALAPHQPATRMLLAHVAGSLLLSVLIVIGIATAWLQWFEAASQ